MIMKGKRMGNDELFNVKKLFKKDLVLLDVECKDVFDLLNYLSNFALEKGLVYPDFKEAVIEREKSVPTGLKMPQINIAIPHTDSKYVKVPQVIVAKLKKKIIFKEMGLEDNDLPVDIVFMLLINNDGHQVFLLQNIINLCMNEEISKKLLSSNSQEEIFHLIQYYYETYAEYCEDVSN